MLCRDTSAGWSAGLSRFKLLAVGDTAADLFDDLAQCGSHRNFYKAGIMNLAAESEYFRSLGLLGSHGGEPLRSV